MAANCRCLPLSHGTTGRLSRIDLATKEVVQVDLRSTLITNADP